jgi:hypothetical protein
MINSLNVEKVFGNDRKKSDKTQSRLITWNASVQNTRILSFRLLHKNEADLTFHLLSSWFLARLILRAWRWRWYVPLKLWLTFNGLHGVISQTGNSCTFQQNTATYFQNTCVWQYHLIQHYIVYADELLSLINQYSLRYNNVENGTDWWRRPNLYVRAVTDSDN